VIAVVDAADVTRWVGVAIACLGAFVVSPAGAQLLVQQSTGAIRRAAKQVQTLAVRWFHRRADDRVTSGTLGTAVTVESAQPVGRSLTLAWNTEAPTDEKIEHLRKQIAHLDRRTTEQHAELVKSVSQVSASLTKLGARVTGHAAEVRTKFAEVDRRKVETDARALPLVGLGVILSGIPEEIAALPTWLLAVVLTSALALTLFVTAAAWRERHPRREGSS
jgi:hypothetical protein